MSVGLLGVFVVESVILHFLGVHKYCQPMPALYFKFCNAYRTARTSICFVVCGCMVVKYCSVRLVLLCDF